MNLKQLLSYSETDKQQYISGSKQSEIGYLKFHYKRFKILLSLVQSGSQGKLLDIGTTPFTFYLSENTNHDVFAFDYNTYLKERSEEFNIHFQSGDLEKDDLPYEDDFFDIVLFAEVFEHIHSDPVKLFKRLLKTIKPGGILILGTPNLASFANRIKLAFNRAILDYPTWDDAVHGHDRIYVKNELISYLMISGFNIQRARYSSCVDFIKTEDDSKIKVILKTIAGIITIPFRFVFPSLKGTILITAQKTNRNDI